MSKSSLPSLSPRLTSLDAYRGFVMLAMASGGLGFASIFRNQSGLIHHFDDTRWEGPWLRMWQTLAFAFDHVDWHGCAFWDLIQPSFMFMVGVALPFSLARRTAEGQSPRTRFLHVLLRSFVLIALGVFLSSNGSPVTNFTFVNVLTQIGLGYPFLYLLAGRRFWLQALVAAAVLGGYGAWFAYSRTPEAEEKLVRRHVAERIAEGKLKPSPRGEFDQFTGTAAKWNKHLNPAASVDRWLLNQFPRDPAAEPVWEGKQFWINSGGYQTLNFIPSFVTMLFGLMAGQLLCRDSSHKSRLLWMSLGGLFCFAVSLGLDTRIWPFHVPGWDWSYCPIVKRIWTPTWTLYSTGWTLWMLAAFYSVIELAGWKKWSFPLVVVGMNSIAMYVFSQLLKPWLFQTAKTHLSTIDAVAHTKILTIYTSCPCAELWKSLTILALLWLMCLWLYRQKIFVRI